MQLSELKHHFELVHLDDWLVRAKRKAPLPRLACAVTFDDGWRDNFDFAMPVLRKHRIPAMIFLVSHLVGSAYQFWPNRLMSLLQKAHGAPDSVSFPEPLWRIIQPVLAHAAEQGELTAAQADQVIVRAKSFDETLIRRLVDVAEECDGVREGSRDLLSREEIAQMGASGLIRFGSHTATHFRLGGQPSSEILQREVARSRIELQDICGQSVDVFCFPNGETSPEAIAFARRHYLGAVTTQKGWHTASGDSHLIRRIGVHEEMSNTPHSFRARLTAWI